MGPEWGRRRWRRRRRAATGASITRRAARLGSSLAGASGCRGQARLQPGCSIIRGQLPGCEALDDDGGGRGHVHVGLPAVEGQQLQSGRGRYLAAMAGYRVVAEQRVHQRCRGRGSGVPLGLACGIGRSGDAGVLLQCGRASVSAAWAAAMSSRPSAVSAPVPRTCPVITTRSATSSSIMAGPPAAGRAGAGAGPGCLRAGGGTARPSGAPRPTRRLPRVPRRNPCGPPPNCWRARSKAAR
jgi:hypothetical protein